MSMCGWSSPASGQPWVARLTDGHNPLLHALPCHTHAVDCLAVTAQSMRGMAAAAESFTADLEQLCPGTKAAASSMGRLPAPAAE